ncbi:carbohydrate ABC transporter permease [Paenibacillus chungangensis]|uniref:Carbohydrate ABC transporter permease n=1 Tax=Paenibacillus chungangensis TaxID=696535 RepID=A0ABW3HKJ6_9BACL
MKQTSNRLLRKENRIAYWMMLPAVIPYILFNLLPILWAVSISFTHYDGYSSPTWAGIDNYIAAIKDTEWWKSVWNTSLFAFGKLAIELPLSLVVAVILNEKIFARNWIRAIFFMPHITSMAVMGLIFFFIFRPIDGILNGILQSLHLIKEPIDYLGEPASAMISIIVVAVWHGFGMNMVLFLAGLQTISKDMYESASLDGATPAQQLWFITVPMLGPVLKIVILLAIVSTLKSFDLIKVLTDGGPFGTTNVMFTYIFDYFFSASDSSSGQYGYGSALGVLATLLIAAVSVIYLRFTRNLKAH